MNKNGKVYLLLGPEAGKKSDFINDIIASQKDKNKGDPDIYRFYPYGLDTSEVVSILKNGSLFAKSKVVVLNRLEELKGKGILDPLIDYCKKPAQDAVLILLSDTVKDVPAAIKRLVPKENTVIFWEMFEGEKKGWVINFFQKAKIRIEPDAVDSLLELVENNTQVLKGECERLSQFFGAGAAITSDQIEDFLYHTKEENVFSLFSRMVLRDLPATLEILTNILLSKEKNADSLLNGILWQTERLLLLKRLIERNYSADDAFKRVGITGKRNQRIYSTGLSNYGLEELERIIRLIYETQVRLRTFGGGIQVFIIQLFFHYAISKGGRAPWMQVSY